MRAFLRSRKWPWAALAMCAVAVACAGASTAQDASAPRPATSTTATPTTVELVITGSRIPQPNLTSVSPVSQIDSADIRAEGAVRIEDVINELPQAFADESSTVDNAEKGNIPGTATVNLRDLGAERTLVLIDGKRLMPGDPTSGSVAPDLNFIPDALVDRIEVVTGGASAVYGSDAIAGVVNFIMKRNFTGLTLDVEAGADNHTNDEGRIQAVLASQDQPIPAKSITDGFTGEVTLVAGADLADDKGNVTVYGGYRAAQAVTQASRDFSACPLTANGADLACSGSMASPALGRFLVLDPATFNLTGDLTLDPTGPGDTLRDFDPDRDAYNYAPTQYLSRPDRRYTGGVFAHYQVLPSVELYADGMVMYDDTVAQLAPSGLFTTGPTQIACASPLLSPDEVQNFCTDANVPLNGSALVVIGRRDVEAGPRQYDLTHLDYRVVVGARGDFGDWRYDLSAQYSAVAVTDSDDHDVSLSRAADALNVIRDGSGNLVCASGNPGCAPYDIFQIGGLTQAAINYIDVDAKATGDTAETVVSGNLTGKLDGYGVKSPWADAGVSVALGAEFRQEGLGYFPDAELASGDLASAGFSSPMVSGHFDVYELYGEARAPLAQDRGPLLQDLTLEGAFRYSWYSGIGGAATYKAGVEWSPNPELMVRVGFNHAVRAPNVVELFTPQSISNIGLDFDPCAGANPIVDQGDPSATQANCARTGVSAAQYGHIAPSPEAYNTLEGGNPGLRPESADTVTAGVVITPRPIPGFNLTADFYDIRIGGLIDSLDPDVTIEQCLQTGNPFLCGLIHRSPGTGSLWIGNDGYVSDLEENAASLETRGVDVSLSYRLALPTWNGHDLGSASLHMNGTYLLSFSTVTQPGAPSYDCAGYYGVQCGDPLPRWRHTLAVVWQTPWRVDVRLGWRYTSAIIVAAASPNAILNMPFDQADFQLGARSYFDVSLEWRLDRRLTFRAGVNNLFDVDPPIVGSDFNAGIAANANTYPGVYDTLGRWLFVGLTAHL